MTTNKLKETTKDVFFLTYVFMCVKKIKLFFFNHLICIVQEGILLPEGKEKCCPSRHSY